MKLVIIDGYTLNPGDLDWKGLDKIESLEYEIYDETEDDKVIDRCKEAEAVFTNKVYFDKSRIDALPNLKYIGVSATGYNIIDLPYAKSKGITVTNVKNYSTPSTAQQAFALLLEVTNQVGLHNSSVKKGEWENSKHFCYWKTPLLELSGKTVGLLGFGQIAQAFAKMCLGFDMNVIVHHPNQKKEYPKGIQYVDIDSLFAKSDILSLHAPLTDDTNEIINKGTLAKMKATAILLNTARGALINEQNLSDALDNNALYGAGLDVLSSEPPKKDNPLINNKKCIISPHVAWASYASRKRLLEDLINNFQSFLMKKNVNWL